MDMIPRSPSYPPPSYHLRSLEELRAMEETLIRQLEEVRRAIDGLEEMEDAETIIIEEIEE